MQHFLELVFAHPIFSFFVLMILGSIICTLVRGYEPQQKEDYN